MNPEPGKISICGDDSLRIEAGGMRLFITTEDVKSLIFYGRVVPISKSVCRTGEGGITESLLSIECRRKGGDVLHHKRPLHPSAHLPAESCKGRGGIRTALPA